MQFDNAGANASPDDDLVERMNAIRNSSERHVVRMHAEAERLVDWREHVRSQPLVAVGVAAAAGFFLMYRTRGSNAPAVRKQFASQEASGASREANRADETVARSSLASGAMAFVGTMAGNMLKQYAANYIKGKLAGVHHDRGADEPSEIPSPRAGQSTSRW